ncbi:MAG: glyoxalase [Bacteroidetes bacterium]|nr:MAG: glyoxalase [Bacteroidota bacterium]
MQKSPIIPVIRYDNAKEAISWLKEAFGFQKHVSFEDEAGKIIHAELTFGNSMIMLGSADSSSEFSTHMRQPREIGGFQTQCCYVYVEDPDAHYAHAVAAGARIVIDIKGEDYGGRSYTCLDPEGFLWNFGSYDPWAEPTV